MPPAEPPLLGFTAFSGTGKTTLLCKLLRDFRARGLRAAVIKHAHETFDIDQPGKDSYELRKAGAGQVLISSRRRWALMVEQDGPPERTLKEQVRHLDLERLDLILVEGFKPEPIPKIEIHRPSLGHPLLFPGDQGIIAVATDAPLAVETTLPVLNLNDAGEIAAFIVDRFLPDAQTGAVKLGVTAGGND